MGIQGVITPYDDTPSPWLWKTEGYIRFSNKISELKDTSPPPQLQQLSRKHKQGSMNI
ncbi:hypothetical protein HTY54_14680 [Escherichia coli]|nr:hypothetical protein [Escherichia coli]